MMLCHDLDGNGEVFYLIKDCAQNKNLWNKDTTLCNNGVVTIGTCFAIVNPNPMRNYFSSDIPLVITNNSVIVFKTPLIFHTTSIDNSVIKNVT